VPDHDKKGYHVNRRFLSISLQAASSSESYCHIYLQVVAASFKGLSSRLVDEELMCSQVNDCGNFQSSLPMIIVKPETFLNLMNDRQYRTLKDAPGIKKHSEPHTHPLPNTGAGFF
jgi:hypothetical protein